MGILIFIYSQLTLIIIIVDKILLLDNKLPIVRFCVSWRSGATRYSSSRVQRGIGKYFKLISERLAERDIHPTTIQCQKKVKLRAEYKQIHDQNISGRNCKFLPQLDAILGHRTSTEPMSVIESGVDNSARRL